jgi:ATP/maltotriose-dependent transcriptional regulator MalT/DNA-binding SARP family transcriptional activator
MSLVVSRPRIEQLLDAVWERRVTLVVAGGGYGKTTALRQLAAGKRSRWLGLRAADREVQTLAGRVAGALGAASGPGVAPRSGAIGAIDRRSLAEGRAAMICEGLDSRRGELLLVLDDVDQLADDDSASQFLSTLCLQAPSRLHLVLSGRRLPTLGLGAARGRGELMELNAPDLAFTRQETASLLIERLGSDARPLAEECFSLTAGWAAGLQLIVDRLERLDSARWRGTLEQLQLRHGATWLEFAGEVIEREEPSAQRVLAVASVTPVVEADLLAALGIEAAEAELESLQTRGLLVGSGEHGARTLSPVLAEAVADRLAAAEAEDLRRRATAWYERHGHLEEALECAAAGPRGEALSLVERCGNALVGRGSGSRVAEVLGDVGTGDDLAIDAILAEALVAVGEWDAAMEVFGAIRRRAAGAPLTAGVAWRFGALLYLRSEFDAAQEVLSVAYDESSVTSDDALVAGWLSSTLWGRGEVEEAERVADVALRQAESSRDPAARGTAHVALALVAASRGDRERNERHYRLALSASATAGDSAQLARIHANLSSKAAEEGDYAGAIEEADLAIGAGAGHNLFSALAMSNKAEALMRTGQLEEARALLERAIEMFNALGSLTVCTPYTQLGVLDAERGDFAHARSSLERAHQLAREADDLHALVVALAALAAVLAEDDPETARRYAMDAATRATSLERAHALGVWSWVELVSGDRVQAARLALQAQVEARRTGDSPSLARALELSAASRQPPDAAQLEAAIGLWREVGDPIATDRAELMLAACRDDFARVEKLRAELSRRGAAPELGVVGLLLAVPEEAPEAAVTTLGRFAVSRAGQTVPLRAWQSRKARDLLKILAARRGRPLTRDAAAEALWPGEAADQLPNRLSVALSTLRKILDPARSHPADHFIVADGQSLALAIDHVRLDIVDFLDAAGTGVTLASQGDWVAAEGQLRRAEALYAGDFLEEDLYEDWAVDCREAARSAAQEVSRLLARAAVRRGNEEDGARFLRRLLERDPYDADAWTALLGAELRLRRYGEARRQHAVYARRMAELGVSAVPLARTIDARP